jgi:hypothetical protein
MYPSVLREEGLPVSSVTLCPAFSKVQWFCAVGNKTCFTNFMYSVFPYNVCTLINLHAFILVEVFIFYWWCFINAWHQTSLHNDRCLAPNVTAHWQVLGTKRHCTLTDAWHQTSLHTDRCLAPNIVCTLTVPTAALCLNGWVILMIPINYECQDCTVCCFVM